MGSPHHRRRAQTVRVGAPNHDCACLLLGWPPCLCADTTQLKILTFDQHGISSHPNHVSLPKGASHLISELHDPHGKPRPRLFTLITVPLREKYVGLLSPLLSKASIMLSQLSRGPQNDANTIIAVSDWNGYLRAHRAMRQHWSQLVWFRWLYVVWSRYMWVNEWVELVPPDQTQSAG